MDPQSATFTPRDELWRWQSEMMRVQQVQADHSERLLRLERRHDDDARMKSVWGTSSPFPGLLGGTPQQAPLSQPPADAFGDFDEQGANLIGSLHLDPDDEPRRMGVASRANSVRFDESANQGHWSHASRNSVELPTRTGSGLSNPILERTFSHKSDGRHSSAGHSVHSLPSGRANSLGLDTTFNLTNSSHSPSGELPGLTPGLFVLGSVPSIIRCWLTTKFKHDALLYAALCTGSHTSFIGDRLVQDLGYANRVVTDENNVKKVKLDVYLPEAITRPASSRSSSPNPQVPSLNVEFTVYCNTEVVADTKAIQVCIGSDVLRAHCADVLFSSNTVSMFDDERAKLSVPLVRPEDERSFKTLCTLSTDVGLAPERKEPTVDVNTFQPFTGLGAKIVPDAPQSKKGQQAPTEDEPENSAVLSARTKLSMRGADSALESVPTKTEDATLSAPDRVAVEQTPEPKVAASDPTTSPSVRSGLSPASLSTWRRETSSEPKTFQPDWASTSKGSSNGASSVYQRQERGIKVLKPIKPVSRAASSAQSTASPSAAASASQTQSRFFDGSIRRSSVVGIDTHGDGQNLQRATSNDTRAASGAGVPLVKTRTNPLGGASAFAWMKTDKTATNGTSGK